MKRPSIALPWRLSRFRHGLWGLLFVAVTAWAGTTYSDFLKALAQRESSMNPQAVNQYGYLGLYQMGSAALQDAGYQNASGAWTGKDGVNSQADYLANPQAQTNAVTAYQLKAQAFIVSHHLDDALGSTLHGIPITASGLIAGYHLVGPSALLNFVRHGIVASDGNGVPITAYLQQFAGYGLPVAGTTYASVQAASPSGGLASITPPSASYTTAPLATASPLLNGGSPTATSVTTAADGFHGATGYAMGDVRALIMLLVGSLALLWYAHTVISSWQGFSNGTLPLLGLNRNLVHGAIVVMLLIYLIW